MLVRSFILLGVAALSSSAASYHSADFTGGIFYTPSGHPFTGSIYRSGPVTGSLVYNDDKVPTGTTPRWVNVLFSDFPDLAFIPPSTALYLNICEGGLLFDLSSASFPAAIQYDNGVFSGFAFVSDFLFKGSTYRLNMQGRLFDIRAVAGGIPGDTVFVSGYLDSQLQNVKVFTPEIPNETSTPEPSSMALLAGGMLSLVTLAKRRSHR